MGYYTRYELKVEYKDKTKKLENPENFIALLRRECKCAEYALDEDGDTAEFCKWYESSKDIKKFSKKYSNLLFTLSGDGEQSGDIWKEYIVNGKSQECKAKITFDDFDESKLK